MEVMKEIMVVNDGSYKFGKTNWKSLVRKVIPLRYEGTCYVCEEIIPVGEKAIWSNNGYWSSSRVEHIRCPRDEEKETV